MKKIFILIIALCIVITGCSKSNTYKHEESNNGIITNKIKEDNIEVSVIEKKLKSTNEILDEILESQKQREYHVYIENLDTGEKYIWGEETFQISALGTVFIPIMLAADEYIEEFNENEADELVKNMIRYSDISAANKLIEMLGAEEGFDKINDMLLEIGCTNTSINRYLGDDSTEKDNYTTSSDMAVMLKYIYKKNNRMINVLMSAAEVSDAIKSTVYKHEGFKSASEYGSAAIGYRESNKSIYNNVGIIIDNNSEKKYVVSIMSSGDDGIDDSINITRKLISTIIDKDIQLSGEKITFKDKNLEKFIRKEINKPTGVISLDDVEMIPKKLSFKNFEFPEEIKNVIDEYKDDCMKKNIVIFEDEKLEDAIRTEINNFRGDILKNEVDKITELYINNRNIKSISGIESLSNLNKLLLYENEISDIEPLRGLTKLRHLDIERNNIKDFNPIKNYVKSLDVFYYDNINRSLVDLDNSQNMSLGPIHDVIMGWFGSHFIGSEINVNIITEITNEHIQNRRTLEGFQAFKNLTRISLPGQMIEDLTPLKNLTKLRQIELQSNSISSIEPLKDLPNLEYIDLRGNNINDIELLKSFRSLPEVHVHHDSVTNDKALDEYYNKFNEMEKNNKETDKISYEKLNFKDKNFERIIRKSINKSEGDILKEDVRHIFSLNGEFAEIRDLSGIENLDNLTHLCLKDNKINSLEPLSELTKLVYLDLSYNKINSLDPLSELTDLISLNLSHNEIVGIEPLKDLTDLNLLGLSFNNVVNIEPLINMNSLNKLELEFNQIGDCELLEEYAKSVRVIYFDNY